MQYYIVLKWNIEVSKIIRDNIAKVKICTFYAEKTYKNINVKNINDVILQKVRIIWNKKF